MKNRNKGCLNSDVRRKHKKSISKYDNSILCYVVSFCVAGFLSFGEALKNLRCGKNFFNEKKKRIANGGKADEINKTFRMKLFTLQYKIKKPPLNRVAFEIT